MESPRKQVESLGQHWLSGENPAQEKCYTHPRGFSPIHARVSPVGVRVCALACVRSRVCTCAYVCGRVRVRAIQRVRVRACATRVLSTGKRRESLAIA
ncbi:hypothetical protein EHFPEHOM_00050 [Vibrio phage vB_Vc_SrVc9]|uniref:Uncharacterized protein n=2 Tax=Maculvirus TaxID=2731958 RepID=A0A7T7GTA1_9CAUD|nr:hypothetical protein vBVcSrVc2_00049 [Vibrio phage vB_Vc_SrVc2]CAB3563621.1 hypothetical protein EHFPEHOM_00050 [Vibrio phage vB_Vc_SrVc9]